MPIYEISCSGCGFAGETLVHSASESLVCPECGGPAEKLMSATSSLTGRIAQAMPGPSDTGCCGTSPAESGCAGPGSCCGKAL